MVKVAITGGTSGVGFEACKQLCAVAEVTGVVLTSRSSANAEKAIERLRSATGKDGSFFEYVVLDLEDLPSIVAAISSFPKVDRICLNGSRLGKCKLHAQSMVTDAMASVLGHTVLTDGLVAAGKLNAGARIVHIGGEIARPLWSFTGLLPNFFSFAEGDLDAAITQNYSDCCCCLPIRMQLGDYKNTKIVGPLFYAGLAAEQSDFHVMSVSPGAMTDTGIFARGFFPAPILKHLSCLFYCLQVTHPVAEGAKRYVSVPTGEPSFPAGAYAMSGTPPPFCCCLWGAKGPLVDNRQYGGGFECCGPKYMDSSALNKAAVAKMRGYQARWFENLSGAENPMLPPLPEQMGRWKAIIS